MDPVTIGLHLGQQRAPTAMAVVQLETRQFEYHREQHYVTRHLAQMPPGSTYPEISKWLGTVTTTIYFRYRQHPQILVNVTGLGQPVLEALKENAEKAGSVRSVYFTHGDRLEGTYDEIILGKARLVSRLQVLLQAGRLHLPETQEARALAQELLDFELRVTEDANERYGAFPVGKHDELVTALGLAIHEPPDQAGTVDLGLL